VGIDTPNADFLDRPLLRVSQDRLYTYTLKADRRPDKGEEFVIDRWPSSRLISVSLSTSVQRTAVVRYGGQHRTVEGAQSEMWDKAA
jgi:hypothetical protein